MKLIRLLSVIACAGLFGLASSRAATPTKETPASKASIRPQGKVKSTDLPALAKVSFQQALTAALAAAPGSVIKAELEVEDGNLMYSFEIVGADKKITEVEIDAGNGKVLAIDKDDARDEKPEQK